MTNEVIERGILSGRIPNEKDWALYFLELTSTHLHFFEGQGSASSRKHLRSTEIKGNDEVNEKKSAKKNIFMFYLSNADGKYIFQCASEDERDKWLRRITKVRNQRNIDSSSGTSTSKPKNSAASLRTSQPPVGGYTRDSRSSVSSTDSGFGPSTDGEVSRQSFVAAIESKPFSSTPSSGDGSVKRNKPASSHSDGGRFSERQPMESSNTLDLNKYSWFWGTMSRQDVQKKLEEEGKVGNFVVRLNVEGTYVMTVWRADAIHHYKIDHSGSLWKFERTAIAAEGATLVDLLDTYMKSCADKSVTPFGDGLHLVYDEPWNPPEVDMEQLSERLREEFSKSMSLESSTSVLPSQKQASTNKSTSDTKPKKMAILPPTKQPFVSQHATPSMTDQPARSRGATKSPIEKSESPSKLNSSLQQSIITLKPKPLIPPTAAVAVESESDNAVYQNWSTPQREEEKTETERSYENWTAEEGSQGGVISPSSNEGSDQIYENTTQRPQPQKRMGKR